MSESHDLPTGTVTFLFTDIEESTRLLKRLGRERYGEVLERHHTLLREAFTGHGGVEIDRQGDAFFAAFRSAGDAVTAAAAAQRALAAADWGEEARVRVRIGIHTGEATVSGGTYVGFAVHQASRIGDLGHGADPGLAHDCCPRRARPRARPSAWPDLGEVRLHGTRPAGADLPGRRRRVARCVPGARHPSRRPGRAAARRATAARARCRAGSDRGVRRRGRRGSGPAGRDEGPRRHRQDSPRRRDAVVRRPAPGMEDASGPAAASSSTSSPTGSCASCSSRCSPRRRRRSATSCSRGSAARAAALFEGG